MGIDAALMILSHLTKQHETVRTVRHNQTINFFCPPRRGRNFFFRSLRSRTPPPPISIFVIPTLVGWYLPVTLGTARRGLGAVPNVTAYPSTTSAPTFCLIMVRCSAVLMCQ